MKKYIFLFLFLLLFTGASALNEDLLYEVEQIRTKVVLGSELELESTKASNTISRASVNLSFVPQEAEGQKIISISYDPEPNIKNGFAYFVWDDPSLGKHEYSIEAEMLTDVRHKRVRSKVPFPIKNLDEEYVVYTQPTKNIDSNDPEIVSAASQLAEGEDDLYVVVNKLVNWIKDEVDYSLDTLTAEASQPASWVIKNKYGVCDEITSLFIAMARSLGIPARYVSGMAYTNWNELNDWGPHAWSQIYYPGIGWVDYDITYTEFGFVDATHIMMKESLDSAESSTNYEWKGLNVDLVPQKLDVQVELLEKTGKRNPQISLITDVYKSKTGFGSYNVVEVEVKNLRNYYLSEEIALANVEELSVYGYERKNIVLKPGESKSLYWLVGLSGDLDDNFVYTIPIVAYSSTNVTGRDDITSEERAKVYERSYMESYIKDMEEEEKKVYSKEVSIVCDFPSKSYANEDIEISCEISNEGNVLLESLKVCLTECETFDLGISKSRQVDFVEVVEEVGERDFAVKVSNKDVTKTEHISLVVLDKPEVEIADLSYPSSVNYGEEFKIGFIIKKKSLADPVNTKLTITRANNVNQWDVDDLSTDQKFTINFDSKQMEKQNEFVIKVVFEDDKGESFSEEMSVFVAVEAKGFLDKIKMFWNKILSLF